MKEKMSFESACVRLEEIIGTLEDTKTPLDEALKLFEEGVGLIKNASAALEEAEQKVTVLTAKKEQ